MVNAKIFSQTIRIFISFIMLCCFSQIASAYSIQISKKAISYTDTRNGYPLILIHAFPTDQRLWKTQQEGLKKNFRIITLDLWGFGRSSSLNGQAATSMTEYADEVKSLMKALHIQKAIVGGESMGGYIALAFLNKYPDNVSGLILSDTQSIADTQEAKEKRETSAQDVLTHGTTQLINGFMPKALSSQASNQTKQFLQQILESQTSTAVASALRGMALRTDTSNLLSQTQIPVLIITGDQDIVISPQQSKNMHQLTKNSALVIIPNAGHLSNLEQPEQWNQAVINMFDKILLPT